MISDGGTRNVGVAWGEGGGWEVGREMARIPLAITHFLSAHLFQGGSSILGLQESFQLAELWWVQGP